MNMGNALFSMISLFLIVIFIILFVFIIINITYKLRIFNCLYKLRKKHKYNGDRINIIEKIIWTIKNGFLFNSFRKRYDQEFKKQYNYNQIKDRNCLKIIDSYMITSKRFFRYFNIVLGLIIIIAIAGIILSLLISLIKYYALFS